MAYEGCGRIASQPEEEYENLPGKDACFCVVGHCFPVDAVLAHGGALTAFCMVWRRVIWIEDLVDQYVCHVFQGVGVEFCLQGRKHVAFCQEFF